MGFSLSKTMLIGNLGNDAEHRFTTSNICVTSFSIATTHSYKDKSENWINETTWHNIVVFGLSDFIKDALKKGAKFYVEGRIKNEEYTDKEGIKRKTTKVIADKYNGIIPLSESGVAPDTSDLKSGADVVDEILPDDDPDLPF